MESGQNIALFAEDEPFRATKMVSIKLLHIDKTLMVLD